MSDLTEQWKNGKLEEYKRYYCKTKWFEDVFRARCYNKDTEDEWWVLENEKYKYNNIYHTKDIEVLAPVPSYDDWMATRGTAQFLMDKNAQLKELLKKTNKFLKDYGFTFDGKDCAEAFKVHTKINQALGGGK